MRKLFPLLFVCSIYLSPCFATIEEESFVQQIKKDISYLNEHPLIWPTFDISSLSSILYFENQHTYGLNLAPHHPDWQHKTINGEDYLYMPTNEFHLSYLSCSASVDGQLAYVYRFHPEGSTQRNREVFLHERFHCYQNERFPTSLSVMNQYKGIGSIENIELAYLETEALKNYLKTSNLDDLKNYIAINRNRSMILDQGSIGFEEEQERIEGIANYVAWNIAYTDRDEMLNAIFHDNDRVSFCAPENAVDCLLKQHYYFTGTALAMVLDKVEPQEWKSPLEQGKITLRSRLFTHFPISDEESKIRLSNAKEKYSINIEAIKNNVKNYQEQIKKILDLYNNQSGIKFRLGSFPSCVKSSGGREEDNFRIDNLTSVAKNIAITAECLDKSFYLNLFSEYAYLTLYYTELKLNHNIELQVDGISMTLQSILAGAQDIKFSNLIVNDPHFSLTATQQHGTLTITEDAIILSFDRQSNN